MKIHLVQLVRGGNCNSSNLTSLLILQLCSNRLSKMNKDYYQIVPHLDLFNDSGCHNPEDSGVDAITSKSTPKHQDCKDFRGNK